MSGEHSVPMGIRASVVCRGRPEYVKGTGGGSRAVLFESNRTTVKSVRPLETTKGSSVSGVANGGRIPAIQRPKRDHPTCEVHVFAGGAPVGEQSAVEEWS